LVTRRDPDRRVSLGIVKDTVTTSLPRLVAFGVPSLRMPKSNGLPRIGRRRSKIQGYGVFALEPINKNKRIIDYAGELITNEQSKDREDRYLSKNCIWVFRVNRRWNRDAAVGGNVARFINHACKPNCWIEIADKTIWIRASRAIQKGEELTYDYSTDGDKTIPCSCRPGCKTKL
jgi:SET domain-containing protein